MNDLSEKDARKIQTSEYGRITVMWQGSGKYYFVPKLGLWFHIHCEQVVEYVKNNKPETIEL